MALISVPAWPMPIHQTKLVMSKAQPTGMLLPQAPMPSDQGDGDRQEQRAGASERDGEGQQPALVRPRPDVGQEVPGEGGVVLLPQQQGRAVQGVGGDGRGGVFGGHQPSSGLGFLILVRYTVRGRVFSSWSTSKRRGSAWRWLTLVFGSWSEPKVDRAGRARLLTGGLQLAVTDGPVLDPRRDAGALDALHAVRALLHHPARPDGDVRVLHHLLHLALVLRPVEVVEVADLVGAVVRAVPGADAPVVDHVVQPLVRVDGGVHRAHVLARRGLAVLAEHGLAHHLR